MPSDVDTHPKLARFATTSPRMPSKAITATGKFRLAGQTIMA